MCGGKPTIFRVKRKVHAHVLGQLNLSPLELASSRDSRFSFQTLFKPTSLYFHSAAMAPKYIKRVTLFKIPKEEDIDAVLDQYDILRKTAQKVPN
jgi:hypothetical protein